MRMRAAVLESFGEPLVVQEVELTDPGPGEALVRLVACGVCHTDLYTASGVDPSGYAPTTGLGAAMNTAQVRAGSTCVVFGAGMVGLGAVAGCRLQGAERIICVDLSADRLQLARGQGATETMLGGEDAVERIVEGT